MIFHLKGFLNFMNFLSNIHLLFPLSTHPYTNEYNQKWKSHHQIYDNNASWYVELFNWQ